MWRFSAKRTVRLHQVHDASSNHLSYRSLMTNSAPGNVYLQTLFLIAFIMTTAYACGRLHQWYRQGTDRDTAFREGYDRATHSLFRLATGAARTRPTERATRASTAVRATATVTAITDAPSAGRHAAPAHHLEATTRIITAEKLEWTRRPSLRPQGELPAAVGE